MSTTVFDRVKQVIFECLPDLKEGEIIPIASFVEDLRADSLDIVELVMRFEEEFEISDEAANNFKTIQDAVDYITVHLED